MTRILFDIISISLFLLHIVEVKDSYIIKISNFSVFPLSIRKIGENQFTREDIGDTERNNEIEIRCQGFHE